MHNPLKKSTLKKPKKEIKTIVKTTKLNQFQSQNTSIWHTQSWTQTQLRRRIILGIGITGVVTGGRWSLSATPIFLLKWILFH